VVGMIWRWSTTRKLLASALALVLSMGLWGCGDRTNVRKPNRPAGEAGPLVGRVAEVSPPATLQALRPALEVYQPQVNILSPRSNEILKDDQVTVRLQVKDFPAFKDEALGLGPHLHVFLDNQPYRAVYNPDEPLTFSDLAPGTHSLRVFASRPWHESFKNEGAYAQTTFHVYTKTPDNAPDPNQPLLTYSRPQGEYGAEPVMLDFYLTNVPLHLIAQERPDDNVKDWKIRCTVNGESFIFDEWQPIYLKGLQPGKNWVQLELLDEAGNPFPNVFNNTVRVITYSPNGTDTLSKLVRGELSAEDARGIVDPNYVPPVPEPEPTPEEITPSPELEVTPSPTPTPSTPISTPESLEVESETEAFQDVEEELEEPNDDRLDEVLPSSELEPPEAEVSEPEPVASPDSDLSIPQEITAPESETNPSIAPSPAPETTPAPRKPGGLGGFFNRRRAEKSISPAPISPLPVSPAPMPTPVLPDTSGDPNAIPTPGELPKAPEIEESAPLEDAPSPVDTNPEPSELPAEPEAIAPSPRSLPQLPNFKVPDLKGFWNRVRPQPISPQPIPSPDTGPLDVIDIPEPALDVPDTVNGELESTQGEFGDVDTSLSSETAPPINEDAIPRIP
jgi:hypothetical protein